MNELSREISRRTTCKKSNVKRHESKLKKRRNENYFKEVFHVSQ